MSQSRSRSAFLIGLFLTSSLIVGCGGDSDSFADNGLEKQKIKVATLSLVHNAPLYLGIKEKLFENEGLDVQAVPVQESTDALPGMSNGSIDVVFGSHATFLSLQSSGAEKVRLLNEATTLAPKHMAVLVKKNSLITTVKDLEGKKVAIHLMNNVQQLTFNAILQSNDVDPTKIKYARVPFPDMGSALEKKDVDALHIMEPYLSETQQRFDVKLVVDGNDGPVRKMPLDGYYVTDDWASKNPRTAAAFQRAMFEAQKLAADRSKIEAILPSFTKINADTARIMNLPGYPTSTNPTRLQRLSDLMSEQGVIKSRLDARTLVFTAPDS